MVAEKPGGPLAGITVSEPLGLGDARLAARGMIEPLMHGTAGAMAGKRRH